MTPESKPKRLKASIVCEGLGPCEPFIDDGLEIVAVNDPHSLSIEGLQVTLTFSQWILETKDLK